jgi:hypothetical protein
MRLGVRTVAQLLAAKPQAIAERLRDTRFTEQTVADWQRETQLILAAPGLAGEPARLLAAAGFASVERLARATPTELVAVLEQLSQASPPSIQQASRWIQCAQQALAEIAA